MDNQKNIDLGIFHKFLEVSNQYIEIKSLLDAFVLEIKNIWDCEAVGIRILDDNEQIPYLSYIGFNKQFYEQENLLSTNCDQCMCINVIKGTINPEYPFYTARGSFYTNNSTRFLSQENEKRTGPTRNACNKFGFESVALIPMRLNDRILGLIHLADSHVNQFTETAIGVLEWIARQLAIAVQRITMEISLKESKQRLEQVGDNIPDGIVYQLVHEPNGRRYCSYMSKGCERLFQVKTEQIMKDVNVIYAMFPPEELDRVAQLEKESIETLNPFNIELSCNVPNGETRWIQWHSRPQKLDNGNFIWDGVGLDITQRKNAEETLKKYRDELETKVQERTRDLSESNESLRNEIRKRRKIENDLVKSEAKYRGLIDNSLVGVLTTTHDGYITFVNDAFVKMFDFEAPQMIPGQRFRRHWRYIEDRDRMLGELNKHGSVINFEAKAVTHKDRHIQILFSAKIIDNEILCMMMDITERKQAEDELRKAYSEIEKLKNRLESECTYLGDEIKAAHDYEHIIGESEAMSYVLYNLERIAPTNTTVLILGESGTGKELIARAIHHGSRRSSRSLVKVDCATLPDHLIESELFGHRKGAFTHALEAREGRFGLADNATIFLDEIGELPLRLQQKLLRVLQDGEYERVGSSRVRHTDVRVIAATNRNLEKDVEQGNFRKDLYYRLNVYPITVPPLRERSTDIPLLVDFILKKSAKRHGKKISIIPNKIMNAFLSYAWPGNVRELENVIERAVIETSGQQLKLTTSLIKNDSLTPPLNNSPMKSLSEMEKEYILMALERTYWKISGSNGAAELLGLNPSTLRGRMLKHKIRRPEIR